MARHGTVTFLEDKDALRSVDKDFRKLVEILHQIPFCASFGVSCSGHFYENDEKSKWSPNSFNPSPWGHLNIVVLPTIPHIQELLNLMKKLTGSCADATFKKIEHVFGPPKGSALEVWEIRVGDNGRLGGSQEEALVGAYFPKDSNEQLYRDSRERCEEIRLFWDALATQLVILCEEHGFNEPAIGKRTEEILSAWDG